MKNTQLAGRYAKALYDVASAEGKKDLVNSELEMMAGVFSDKELQAYFSSPLLDAIKKKEIVDRLIQAGKFDVLTANFAKVLADRSRLLLLEEIKLSYSKLVDESNGVIRGEALSASDLNEAQQKELQSKVEKVFNKKILLNFRKDTSLLGGVVIRVGDYTLDYSVDRQLNQIKESLNEGAQ